MKSKSASVTNNDIFDEEDLRFDRDNVKTSYRRLKENKQKMYYVSILFMITAQSMKDLEEMEEFDEVFLYEPGKEEDMNDKKNGTVPIYHRIFRD